ncbi:MAG TPA: hypothetical protein VL371_02430 [Gemmataceae bacterium]|nr:hypothetical protein [Gemmataceae bacterium]
MTPRQLSRHLRTDRYGDFRLTDAIRPAPKQFVVPVEGYRRETYRGRAGLRIPALAAAVSAERVFDTFLALLDPLGDVLDVVLETSHMSGGDRHRDLRRWSIDRPVLASYFCEYEELLLNDGCTGVAVIATDGPMELQFDEHKQLVCYAHDLKPFQAVLRSAGVPFVPDLRLISEGAHLHHSRPAFACEFHDLALRLGVGTDSVLNAER